MTGRIEALLGRTAYHLAKLLAGFPAPMHIEINAMRKAAVDLGLPNNFEDLSSRQADAFGGEHHVWHDQQGNGRAIKATREKKGNEGKTVWNSSGKP